MFLAETQMKPLDPDLAQFASFNEGQTSLFDMEPEQARTIFNAITTDRPNDIGAEISVELDRIQTDDGEIPVRVYRPRTVGVVPTIVFLHGGGYVLGGVEQMDFEARLLSLKAASVVVSVEYRLAPEHRLPAAHLDAVSALLWAYDQARTLGGDPLQVCVAGESAGANLAASAAIAMRDQGIPLAAQLLVVPAPDFHAMVDIGKRTDHYPMLSCQDLGAIARMALPSPDAANRYPYSAFFAETHDGLAPAVIGLAGHCPTRSIGQAYAERLIDAGVEVRLHLFENMFHPFFAFAHASPAAMAAVEDLAEDLLTILALRRIVPRADGVRGNDQPNAGARA